MSPTDPSPGKPGLSARLTVESAAWQALLNLLGEEEQALVDGDADRLTSLNASKLAQLHTLDTLAQARCDALRAAGHTPDHDGMEAWLGQLGDPAHRAGWAHLRELEQLAQAINRRIGSLIDLRLSSTRQALNVLIHAATRQGGLYDQAGQAVAARNSNPLTAA